MTKLIIFDLDGTLVNAYRAIEISLNFTLKQLGYPPVGVQMVRRCVGWGDKNFIKNFVSENEVTKALKIYRRHHKISLLKHSKVIPEAKKVLNTLRKKNLKLAIVSNRPRRFTNILLKHLGLREYFDAVACGKNKKDLKPNPALLLRVAKRLGIDRSEAIYVGDMAIDVLAGRDAGVRTIAVTGGSSSKAELRQAEPFRVINRVSDVLKIV